MDLRVAGAGGGDFVRRMITEGKLIVDERGLVTMEALGIFYKAHALELD